MQLMNEQDFAGGRSSMVPGRERAENLLAARKGVAEAVEPLGVTSGRLAPGGERSSSDPITIGCNQVSH